MFKIPDWEDDIPKSTANFEKKAKVCTIACFSYNIGNYLRTDLTVHHNLV